jgi:hypothetical protein
MHDLCLQLEKCRQKTKPKFDFSEAKIANNFNCLQKKLQKKNWEKDTLRKKTQSISNITYKISTFVLQKLIVIRITYAVGFILQRQVFSLKHDRESGVFKKNERYKMSTALVLIFLADDPCQ